MICQRRKERYFKDRFVILGRRWEVCWKKIVKFWEGEDRERGYREKR